MPSTHVLTLVKVLTTCIWPAALTFVVDAMPSTQVLTLVDSSLDHVHLASSPHFCRRCYAVDTSTNSGGFILTTCIWPAALTFVVDAMPSTHVLTLVDSSLDHVHLASSPHFCHFCRRCYAVGICSYRRPFIDGCIFT